MCLCALLLQQNFVDPLNRHVRTQGIEKAWAICKHESRPAAPEEENDSCSSSRPLGPPGVREPVSARLAMELPIYLSERVAALRAKILLHFFLSRAISVGYISLV